LGDTHNLTFDETTILGLRGLVQAKKNKGGKTGTKWSKQCFGDGCREIGKKSQQGNSKRTGG